MQNEDIHRFAAAAGFNRGRPCIARGRANNGHALSLPGQQMVIKQAEKLKRHILEGERRSVIQLHQEVICAHLPDRHHRLVGEGGIGLLGHGAEVRRLYAVPEERLQQKRRRFCIAHSGKGLDILMRELRPAFRQVKTAVARQARQDHFFKIQYRRFAACADITHCLTPYTEQKAAESNHMPPHHTRGYMSKRCVTPRLLTS